MMLSTDSLSGGEKKMNRAIIPPKTALSAFIFFANEKRAALIQEQRDAGEKVSFAEVAKKIGEMWKELEDKSEYEAQAAEDEKRFEVEMKNYMSCREEEEKCE